MVGHLKRNVRLCSEESGPGGYVVPVEVTRQGRETSFGEACGQRVRELIQNVGDHYRSTLLRHPSRDRGADASGATRDERDATRNPILPGNCLARHLRLFRRGRRYREVASTR